MVDNLKCTKVKLNKIIKQQKQQYMAMTHNDTHSYVWQTKHNKLSAVAYLLRNFTFLLWIVSSADGQLNINMHSLTISWDFVLNIFLKILRQYLPPPIRLCFRSGLSVSLCLCAKYLKNVMNGFWWYLQGRMHVIWTNLLAFGENLDSFVDQASFSRIFCRQQIGRDLVLIYISKW